LNNVIALYGLITFINFNVFAKQVTLFNYVAGIFTIVFLADLVLNLSLFGMKILLLRKVLVVEMTIQLYIWIMIAIN
jgi:hypothetical protein